VENILFLYSCSYVTPRILLGNSWLRPRTRWSI